MKRHRKIFTTIALALCAAVATVTVGGCSVIGGGNGQKTVYELPHYSGTEKGELDEYSKYNKTLWRRNTDTVRLADPQIFDNTAVDGYYYLYATTGEGFTAYRTKDFSSWESAGEILSGEGGWSAYWAPEVISETDETGNTTYYLFFSATPAGIASDTTRVMYVAKANSPAGPFKIVDFTDPTDCGEENKHSVSGTEWSRKAFFDYTQINAALNNKLGTTFSADNLPSLIDAHPHVMSNGDKYVYFSLETPRCIVGMKLDNYLKVDYSTVTVLTRVGYYTTEDYDKEKNGETVEKIEYELIGAEVNEGPSVIEHNGKYYLTFSVNGYEDASYSIMQAVADSPLGPYRKLRDDENGLFLSADIGGNAALSGTGHHSFFTVGNSLYICYHRHIVNGSINGGRMLCVDELKWITVGEAENQLDVLYANGPTITVQPRFDSEAEYINIAEQGTVSLVSGTLKDGSTTDFLNDGLLSYNTTVSQGFLNKYVQETVSTGTATYEISFATAQEVRGFIIYGSKFKSKYFSGVYNIEVTVEENGAEKTYYIEKLEPDDTCIIYNEDELALGNHVVESVVYGSGVYAEFDALKVKNIRFTVKPLDGESDIGLSEIAVIGKRS